MEAPGFLDLFHRKGHHECSTSKWLLPVLEPRFEAVVSLVVYRTNQDGENNGRNNLKIINIT